MKNNGLLVSGNDYESKASPMDMLASESYIRSQPLTRSDLRNGSVDLPDLICLSHLRWDFVYQRPQHLLSRFARERRVFFVEEPLYDDDAPRMEITRRDNGVWVAVPHLPAGMTEGEAAAWQQSLLQDELMLAFGVSDYLLWYYTPLALAFTRHLEPLAVVYDCMDELSGFRHASPALKRYETELFERADVVFTGGYTLYEAKALLHPNVHPFPSSIDAAHFRQARTRSQAQPADQAILPGPRLGYCGVIDERLDYELLAGLADARPDWQFIMIGPVVKVDPAELPQRANIHYLGGKQYQELPAYLSGWDIALLPFARNEATRYISPTKTPEYLAAGVPAISTPISDVVRPWGESGLVKIGETAPDFIEAAERLMSQHFNRAAWLQQVDKLLASNSWDRTWTRMATLVNQSVKALYPQLITQTSSLPSTITQSGAARAALAPSAGD